MIQAWNFTEAPEAMTSVALVLALVLASVKSHLEFHRGYSLHCPSLGLGALSKCSPRHSDILMEVPSLKTKWPCPFKNEIPGLLIVLTTGRIKNVPYFGTF